MATGSRSTSGSGKENSNVTNAISNRAGHPRGAQSSTPASYEGFDGQYIGGSWRPGRIGTKVVDRDPYSGEVIAAIIEGDLTDLDEAYRAAAKAQIPWTAITPAARSAVMLRAVSIMDARHDEIAGWLTRESGGTRVKAQA